MSANLRKWLSTSDIAELTGYSRAILRSDATPKRVL